MLLVIILEISMTKTLKFHVQLRVTWRQLNLLENLTAPVPTFTVAKEDPVILLNKGEGELFAGKINKVRKLKLFIFF